MAGRDDEAAGEGASEAQDSAALRKRLWSASEDGTSFRPSSPCIVPTRRCFEWAIRLRPTH